MNPDPLDQTVAGITGWQIFALILAGVLALKAALLIWIMARDLRPIGLPCGAIASLVAAAVMVCFSIALSLEFFDVIIMSRHWYRLLFGVHTIAIAVLLIGVSKRLTSPAAAVARSFEDGPG